MYSPAHFTVTDPTVVDAMLLRAPLGCLVTHGPEGLYASHLPLLHDRARGVLAGHLARANPHRDMTGGGQALVVFQAVDAYVSPNWYPGKAEGGRVVPTWNYEAVHVYGELAWIEDAAWVRANVAGLADRFEAAQPQPWALDDAPADYVAGMLKAIVGVEIRIARVEAKRKLSQNRGAADRKGVIAGLGSSAREADRAVAALMAAEPAGR
jgi:transcriptional regulator